MAGAGSLCASNRRLPAARRAEPQQRSTHLVAARDGERQQRRGGGRRGGGAGRGAAAVRLSGTLLVGHVLQMRQRVLQLLHLVSTARAPRTAGASSNHATRACCRGSTVHMCMHMSHAHAHVHVTCACDMCMHTSSASCVASASSAGSSAGWLPPPPCSAVLTSRGEIETAALSLPARPLVITPPESSSFELRGERRRPPAASASRAAVRC